MPKIGDDPRTLLPLTRQERLRRTVLICCACSRNLTYFRCGWEDLNPRFATELQATINGNFLDVGLLEWCKLFGDNDEEHHWSQVLPEIPVRRLFRRELFAAIGCARSDFNKVRQKSLTYRNEFVAHLGSTRRMDIPTLDAIIASAMFFHGFLLAHQNDGTTYGNLPSCPEGFQHACRDAGERYYGAPL